MIVSKNRNILYKKHKYFCSIKPSEKPLCYQLLQSYEAIVASHSCTDEAILGNAKINEEDNYRNQQHKTQRNDAMKAERTSE